jgi:hypothetical protein
MVTPRSYVYRGGVGLRMGAMTTLTQYDSPTLKERKRKRKTKPQPKPRQKITKSKKVNKTKKSRSKKI